MRLLLFTGLSGILALLLGCNPNNSPAGVDLTPPDEVMLRDPIPTSDLPTVILDYIEATYPGITITLAEIETDGNGTVTYEVTLSSGVELNFDANGNLLSDDDNGHNDGDDNDNDDGDDSDNEEHIPFAQLPAPIVDYVSSNYPNFRFDEAERDTLCDLVPLIEISLEDTTANNQEVKLAFTETGELVFTLAKVLTVDLPAPVISALTSAYPDHTAEDKVKQLTAADGTVRYLVEVESNQPGGTDLEVLLEADGTIVCDEPEDD